MFLKRISEACDSVYKETYHWHYYKSTLIPDPFYMHISKNLAHFSERLSKCPHCLQRASLDEQEKVYKLLMRV